MSGYVVRIRDTETGVERDCRMESEWHEASEFLWSDGNFACDCNRQIFFREAAGEESDDEVCGTTRFKIVSILLPDGTTPPDWEGEE